MPLKESHPQSPCCTHLPLGAAGCQLGYGVSAPVLREGSWPGRVENALLTPGWGGENNSIKGRIRGEASESPELVLPRR